MAASLLLLAGCSAETTAPTAAAAASSDLLGGVLGGVTGVLKAVLVPSIGLQRTTPLSAAITVSQSIGSAGGTLSIPAAGVTVTVPAGAVSVPTQFSMTARAGSLIAYDFAPHGTTFAKPLVFKQSLTGTNATLLNKAFIQLGYYADPNQLNSVGGLLSELTFGVVDLLSWNFTANIKHFSGYMVACGRE
ncbi:MAG: hypothetical protein M3Z05_11150 [Gemmatimonadota bacterium]|nr:hypothetical protein [Gemmatimonadota bacterium]